MLTGILFHLGVIQGDPAKLHQIHFSRQQRDLHEQGFNLGEKASAKGSDRVVVWMRVGRQVTEHNRVASGAFNLAAGKDAGRVSIYQQTE